MKSICFLMLTLFGTLYAADATVAPFLPSIPAPTLAKTESPKLDAPVTQSAENIVTQLHTIHVDDSTLEYDSTTGFITLKDGSKKESAHIFFTAYFLQNAAQNRPIIFCFNGGPGCSSIFLHMGAFGPKKVVLKPSSEGASDIPGTYKDNEETLLQSADLVFVDPPSTGFSLPADGVEAKNFYGVKEDASLLADFMRSFLTRYHRWSSPLYIMGESYGTVRAVAIADSLANTYQIPVSGLILISSVLDYEAYGPDNNDLSLLLAVPTFTTCAWYHHKLPSDLQEKNLADLLDEVEDFVSTDLRYALFLGNAIDESYKKEIAQKLARYTGLSEQYVLLSNLRVQGTRFIKQLLRTSGQTIGVYDGRFVSDDLDVVGEDAIVEPSTDAIEGSFITAYQTYLTRDLGWTQNEPYYALNMNAFLSWKGISSPDVTARSYLNVLPLLQKLMAKNTHLRLFVASGLYDHVTPYFAADYAIGELEIPESSLNRITQAYYEAGHMMYVNEDEHKALKEDIEQFLQGTSDESTGN